MKRFISVLGLNSVLEVLPVMVAVAFMYWLLRRKRQRQLFGQDFKNIRKNSRANEIIRLLFLCWVVVMICMTLTPTGFWGRLWDVMIFQSGSIPSVKFEKWRFVSVWWTHFVEYSGHYIHGVALVGEILNSVENIILFVPLGLGLPFIWREISFVKVLLLGASCSFLIEFIQAFIGRDGNIDDLLCNTAGGLIGYLLFLLLKSLFPKFTEKCKTSAKDIWTQNRRHSI